MNRLMLLFLPFLLTACGTFGRQYDAVQDGAPADKIDIASIPDAVPRDEPLSSNGNPSWYEVNGKRYEVLKTARGYKQRGVASWYGTKFHGKATSSGEPYDMYAMTAAHKTLPIPSYAKVTNLENGNSVVVRINDRGPFHDNRLIDLSYAAATKLGIVKAGTGVVEVSAITGDEANDTTAELSQGRFIKTYGYPNINSQSGANNYSESNVYVQVGAFSDRENVYRLLRRLMDFGLNEVHISRASSVKSTIYQVRIGPLASVKDADRMSEVLTNLGFTKPNVVVE